MVIANITQPIISEGNQALALFDMGGQQSRLRNDTNIDAKNIKLDENKTNCWKFKNCHKFRNQNNNNDNNKLRNNYDNDVYKPYSSTLNENFNKNHQNLTTNDNGIITEKNIEINNDKINKELPSIAAGTIVGTWKTDSLKRPENLSIKSTPRTSAEESTSPLTKTTNSIAHDSTTTIYSDVSSTKASEITSDYLLSEHSQDMLMHIIRCFPFPSPKNSPRVVKRQKSTLSSNDVGLYSLCEAEPSSSDQITSTVKPKKHLFTKHGNPMTSLFYRYHLQQEKRKRAGSSISDNQVNKDLSDSKSVPSTPTTSGRPYAYSTTSAPGICGNNEAGNNNSNGSLTGLKKGALSTLCQVSVDTMAITALPLDCWLKERLKNWVQLSGHEGTIVPATNQTLWKKLGTDSVVEAKAYEQITKDKVLDGITPKFYKEIKHKNESFIEIQDLLADFPNMQTRAVMDIKIGTRTFLESEVCNNKKRADLYEKMIAIDPDEPTEEEKEEKAITKLRYMQFRERESSSHSLGFRIEAAQLPGGMLQKSFKKVKTREQILDTLKLFLGERYKEVSKQFEQRLRDMRDAVEKSVFFKTHEVVGSSILFIYDEKKSGAWMIDFAKTTKIDENNVLNHRTPWMCGNHEDGYLVGLDNLIDIFSQCHSKTD